ncbi:hypothetical protein [Pendulispora albinea]|uniref:Uncharacterized protein n=1 Tax=Pendulispora albinea TaxID=2741071 RepID=A0ABZ2LRF0_9BACT
MNRIASVPLLVTVIALCGACAGEKATAPPPTAPSEARNAELVRPGNETPEANLPPSLRVTLSRAREQAQECLPEGSGKVNVLVTRREGSLVLTFAPDASLDPRTRHCILETLSTYNLEEVGGNTGGTSYKPSGYTSIIQVSW